VRPCTSLMPDLGSRCFRGHEHRHPADSNAVSKRSGRWHPVCFHISGADLRHV